MKLIKIVALCMLATITANQSYATSGSATPQSATKRAEGALFSELGSRVGAAKDASQKMEALQVAQPIGAQLNDVLTTEEDGFNKGVIVSCAYALKAGDKEGWTPDNLTMLANNLGNATWPKTIESKKLAEECNKSEVQKAIGGGFNASNTKLTTGNIMGRARMVNIDEVQKLISDLQVQYPNIVALLKFVGEQVAKVKEASIPNELRSDNSGQSAGCFPPIETDNSRLLTKGEYEKLTKDDARDVFYTMTLAELNEISTDGLQDGVVDILLEVISEKIEEQEQKQKQELEKLRLEKERLDADAKAKLVQQQQQKQELEKERLDAAAADAKAKLAQQQKAKLAKLAQQQKELEQQQKELEQQQKELEQKKELNQQGEKEEEKEANQQQNQDQDQNLNQQDSKKDAKKEDSKEKPKNQQGEEKPTQEQIDQFKKGYFKTTYKYQGKDFQVDALLKVATGPEVQKVIANPALRPRMMTLWAQRLKAEQNKDK